MAKNKNKASELAWRFYRSSLSTIVWDPDAEKALADFSEGHFTTNDPRVAQKLRELGYVEIPLDAEEPPDGVIVRQPTMAIDGDVPIMGRHLKEGLAAEKRISSKAKTVGGPPQVKQDQGKKQEKKLAKRRKK